MILHIMLQLLLNVLLGMYKGNKKEKNVATLIEMFDGSETQTFQPYLRTKVSPGLLSGAGALPLPH